MAIRKLTPQEMVYYKDMFTKRQQADADDALREANELIVHMQGVIARMSRVISLMPDVTR